MVCNGFRHPAFAALLNTLCPNFSLLFQDINCPNLLLFRIENERLQKVYERNSVLREIHIKRLSLFVIN